MKWYDQTGAVPHKSITSTSLKHGESLKLVLWWAWLRKEMIWSPRWQIQSYNKDKIHRKVQLGVVLPCLWKNMLVHCLIKTMTWCFPASVKIYWDIILNYAVWKHAVLIYDFKEVAIMKLNYCFWRSCELCFKDPAILFPRKIKK